MVAASLLPVMMLLFGFRVRILKVLFDRDDQWVSPRLHMLSGVDWDGLLQNWWGLHAVQRLSLLPELLLHCYAAKFFFLEPVVLFLLLGFGEHDLHALRSCNYPQFQYSCLQSCLLGLPYFFQLGINSL